MSAAEVASFLAGERTVTCATVGPRGWPHLMPLWYVLRWPISTGSRPGWRDRAPTGWAPLADRSPTDRSADGDPGPRVWAWTYAASQKVRNLERDPRATLQVEAGEAYEDLRGVMLECDVVIHRDLDVVAPLGEAILLRNSVPRGVEPPEELPSQARDAVAAQAAKRVALEFLERRRASWDHRKLGGVY